jgi:superoxide dismutase, Cu-Zn family
MKIFALLTLSFSLSVFAANHTFDITDGSGKLIGQGSMSDSKKGVKLTIELKGAQPGLHAMHIHEKGMCQGPKFETAGGHLNPSKKKHGHQNAEGAHLGDLGNIEVPASGNVKKEIALVGIDLKPGSANSLMSDSGTSIVFHAKADDEKTDPSGGSGERIYCGVLTNAKSLDTAAPNK